MKLKKLAKMITKTEQCKEFCFGYAEIFLDVILKEILDKKVSDEQIDNIISILGLAERV